MKKVLDFLKSTISVFVVAFMTVLLIAQLVMLNIQAEFIVFVFMTMIIIFSYILGLFEGTARRTVDFLSEYIADSSQE